MMTVTLKNDMRPWRAGDDIHVSDALADALIAAGDAGDLRPFRPMGYEAAMVEPGAVPTKRKYVRK